MSMKRTPEEVKVLREMRRQTPWIVISTLGFVVVCWIAYLYLRKHGI